MSLSIPSGWGFPFFCSVFFVEIVDLAEGIALALLLQDATEGHESDSDGEKITVLEKINRLESFFSWDSLLLGPFNKGIDVFHASKVGNGFLDLLDGSWFDGVGSLAEESSVLEKTEEVVTVSRSADVLSRELLDPFKEQFSFIIVVLAGLLGHNGESDTSGSRSGRHF